MRFEVYKEGYAMLLQMIDNNYMTYANGCGSFSSLQRMVIVANNRQSLHEAF